MTGVVYVTIYTGALVRHAKASLAYGSWPLPFNNLVPHTEQDWASSRYGIYHFCWIMITFIHAIKNYSENRTIRYGYTAAFILIIYK